MLRRYSLPIALFALLPFVAFPLFAIDVPPHPETLALSIDYPVEQAGQEWIGTHTAFTMIFPLPLETVRNVIQDYRSYPRFTPRLTATDVLIDSGHEARIRQHYCVELLGFRFPTVYELLIVADDSGLPGRWRQTWSLAYSDGSIGASNGEWLLEAIQLSDGTSATRATVRNSGLVRKDFPLQVAIMRHVAEKELGKGLVAIYQEAVRRAALAGAAP